jgi:Fe2+ or Zn2+ uptake regulation protein
MLSEIMGDYPRVKVIEILITHPWSEYTKKDLSRASGISRRTLYTLLDQMETYQIIKPTRKIGSAQLYTLNRESKTTHALMTFQKELAEIEIDKQLSMEDQLIKGESVIQSSDKK